MTAPGWDQLPYTPDELEALERRRAARSRRGLGAVVAGAVALLAAGAAVVVVAPWSGDSGGITPAAAPQVRPVADTVVMTVPSTVRYTAVVTTTHSPAPLPVDVLAADSELDDSDGITTEPTSSEPAATSSEPEPPVPTTPAPTTAQAAAPKTTAASKAPKTSKTSKSAKTTITPDTPDSYLDMSASVSAAPGMLMVTVRVHTNVSPVAAVLHAISGDGQQSIKLSPDGDGTLSGSVEVPPGPVEWWVATTAGELSYTTAHSTVTIL